MPKALTRTCSLLALAAALVLAAVHGRSLLASESCRSQTENLAATEAITLALGEDSRPVRLALNARQRAAGLSHLCPEVVARTPMLFVYPDAHKPRFVGRDMHTALDLAWIDVNGRVVGIERLAPGGAVVPETPVVAVLEAAFGRFEHWALEHGQLLVDPATLTELRHRAEGLGSPFPFF